MEQPVALTAPADLGTRRSDSHRDADPQVVGHTVHLDAALPIGSRSLILIKPDVLMLPFDQGMGLGVPVWSPIREPGQFFGSLLEIFMHHFNRLKPVATMALIAALSACANPPGTTSTAPTATTYPSASVQYARVTNVELVNTQATSSGIGAGTVVGGLVGGVLGHQIGGGTGQDIATVAGVVGGALIGNAIQKKQAPAAANQIYRVTVQQNNGVSRAFDYAEQPNVRVGDRVRVENNQLYR